MNISNFVKISAALLMVFFSSQSFASCSQGELTGQWYFGGANLDTAFGGAVGLYCKVKVAGGGAVNTSSSSCEVSEADNKVTFAIVNGELKVNSGCQVTGFIRLCEDEDCFKYNINGARLDKGKGVITWTSRRGGEPDNFQTMTGIKK
jgi:hypothetical protein